MYQETNQLISKKKTAKNQFKTLSTVVYSVQADLEEGTERFATYLNYAQDLYSRLAETSLREVNVVELKMNDWKEVAWPSDMVGWTKVGVRCGDMIKIFNYDNNIPLLKDIGDDHLPEELKDCPHVDDLYTSGDYGYMGIYPYYGVSNDLLYGYKFFGQYVAHNYLGYFREDSKNRTFVFRDTISRHNKIYLEYVSSGVRPNESTIITSESLFTYLKAHVHYCRVKWSKDEPMNQKLLLKDERTAAEMDFDLSNMKLSMDDIRQALREGYTQLPTN